MSPKLRQGTVQSAHALHPSRGGCCVQMGTVTKIPGNKPDIATNNPVADNSGGSAKPEEAKPNA